ncbi:hypothetical protein OS493_019327 [Desmophyllum pertusum]|uniref:Uncharacterized protein n=1 Tax=Desmophyllum pertusum TaxID=174260 RepID=A0A9X0D982_9CNID|nr:hypothetical protein OS493_019327 [Desmophyllum pertusum]
MVTDCETSLSFLALNGFVATKIEVFNHDTQEYETISLIDEEATAVSFRTETLTNEEIDEINLLLYTKEGFMISNEAYHKLSMGVTGNSWHVFVDLVQQLPPTLAFGANVNYMTSMTREKNGLSLTLQRQGLEKLNDKTTKDFFRSTNQRGLDALTQIVQKRNRMEHLEDLGCQRKTRTF